MTKNIPIELNLKDELEKTLQLNNNKEKEQEGKNSKVHANEKGVKKIQKEPLQKGIQNLSTQELKKAMILSEILQKPLALRRRK